MSPPISKARCKGNTLGTLGNAVCRKSDQKGNLGFHVKTNLWGLNPSVDALSWEKNHESYVVMRGRNEMMIFKGWLWSWRFGTRKSITKSTSSDKTYASSAIASLMMWFFIWDADSWRLILKPIAPICGKTQKITEKNMESGDDLHNVGPLDTRGQNEKWGCPQKVPISGGSCRKTRPTLAPNKNRPLHFTSALTSNTTRQVSHLEKGEKLFQHWLLFSYKNLHV